MSRKVYYGSEWVDLGGGGLEDVKMEIIPSTWPRSSSSSSAFTGVGVFGHASSHTKGAWVKILDEVTEEFDQITLIHINVGSSSGRINGNLADLGFGSGGGEPSEVWIENIGILPTLATGGVGIDIPITGSPTSEGIWARYQNSQTSGPEIAMAVLLWRYPLSTGLRSPNSEVDTLGADTSNSRGVQLTVSGTFEEVIASTSRDYRGIVVCPIANDNAMTASLVTFDIGIGSSFDNVYHAPRFYATSTTENFNAWACGSTYISVPGGIPAGTRLGARYVDTASGNNPYSIVLLGIPVS